MLAAALADGNLGVGKSTTAQCTTRVRLAAEFSQHQIALYAKASLNYCRQAVQNIQHGCKNSFRHAKHACRCNEATVPVRVQPHHSKQAPCTGAVLFAMVKTDSPYAELMQRDKTRLVLHVTSSP